MKTVTSLFLVALLVASAYAECVTRGPADVYVGDHTPLDQVLECSGSLQSVALPASQLGGYDATTFEIEVYPRAYQGCAFSYGADSEYVALRFVQDDTNRLGQVHFTVGTTDIYTEGILALNQWSSIAVVVANNAPVNGQITGATAQVYVNGVPFSAKAVGVLTSASKTGSLGFCGNEKTYFNGALDNFIITAKAKDGDEIVSTHNLIFPFVLENDLVQMWTFNDDGDTTDAFVGLAATATASASLVAPASVPAGKVAASTCVRSAKTQFPGAKTTDVFCRQSGSVALSADSSVDSMSNVAPFQDNAGGLSQTFACSAGAAFTFNQKWSLGGVVEATVKTSLNHRFRIAANLGGALLVDHQSWGGWTRLSSGSGIIPDDGSAYSIGDDEFVIQAPGIGWLSITQSGGFLSYQYALMSTGCPEATCAYVTAQIFQYNFNNPPLPEPMGNVVPAASLPGLPVIVACPPPVLNGYNPFMYCWGWWIGPQVGYRHDWNGNPWQMSDPGCCNNPILLNPSQTGSWSYSDWGYMVQGKTLPWCEDQVVPPIDPPKPATSIPTYPTNPCDGLNSTVTDQYKATCAALWGSDQTDGRFIGCVAQLCVTADPTTIPPPDCRTERLLASMDPNYQVPSTCNDCPNSCNFHGTCNSASLTCTCSSGWTGPDCGQPANYACFALNAQANINPVQLYSLDPKYPTAPVLDIQMSAALYTQYAWPGKYSMADTLFVYLSQSQQAYNAVAPQLSYHLWLVSNNGNGVLNLDYQVDVTFTSTSSSMRVDLFGASDVGGGTTQTSATYPLLDRAVASNTASFHIINRASGVSGVVIRNLAVPASAIATAASGFGVTLKLSGSSLPSQVVYAGASASGKAVMDVTKISRTQATSGFQLKGGNCNADLNGCSNLDCSTCAATNGCGWCIETAQCQPGSAAAPALGQCLNWRYSFDTTTNRRVTQIPAYPVNPGLTEVFVASNSDLPVSLGIVPASWSQSEWDIMVFNDFGNVQLSPQIQTFLSAAKQFPNSALYFSSLMANTYALVQPRVNPRASDSIPTAITVVSSKMAAATDVFDIAAILTRLVTANDIDTRSGSRKVALFMIGRAPAATTISATTRDALLAQNIVPVFAVSTAFQSSYNTFVQSLGFGSVIALGSNYDSTLNNALAAAGSSVTVTVAAVDEANTHLDWTSFSTDMDRWTVSGLPETFRAMFSLPVSENSISAVVATNVYVPGYGSAQIENIPAQGALAPEAPWPTNSDKYSILNTATQLIDLTGMSFRGLLAVTPNITALNMGAIGQLFRAVRTVDASGAPTYSQGDLITAVGTVVTDAKVIFVPAAGASGTVTFNYKVFDRCVQSAESTVTIEVTAANTAPVANMPNIVTPQWTPIDFALGFGDDQLATGGTYKLTITQAPAAADGAMYQFVNNFDKTNLAQYDSIKIVDGSVIDLASGQNRFIYLPAQYKYSDAPAGSPLSTLPCFSYMVTETGATTLASNEKQVLITVTHVNVPPFYWEQPNPAWPVALLGDWPAVADGICWDSCSFEEDFGQQYWWDADLENIYLGGNDVEASMLNITISSLDCFPGTTILPPLDNENSITVGYTLYNNEPGQLLPLLRWRPVRETYDGTWATVDATHATDYYCKIGYTVYDDQGAASPEKIITLSVSQVNKQPRLESAEVRKTAVEQVQLAFFLDVVDPENDAITTEFLGCSADQGVLSLCKTIDCAETITVDCSNIYNPDAPNAVTLDVQAGVVTDNGVAPLQAFFTSGPIANTGEGTDYNIYYFRFSDSAGISPFPPSVFAVHVDVVVINNPPVISIQDDNRDSLSVTVNAADAYNGVLSIADSDFDNEDFYYMTFTATLDNSLVPAAKFDANLLKNSVTGCADKLIINDDATSVEFTCQLPVVNLVLGQLSVVGPIVVTAPNNTVTITVVASDNGFVGQCNSDTVTNDLCVLTDTASIQITYVVFAGNSAITVASSAAAAGVAGAAAIAAVALFRKFNRKAEESYAPWDADEGDQSTAVNPLYEESGSKGENPIFEAKTNL